MTAAVQVHGLVRRYGALTAVDGLDLTVEAGTMLALLGPNGAGKTTTVEICEGFARPDEGSVRVLGLDPWADAAALRPRMGLMLQSAGAHLSARTGEMLRLVAACCADPHDPDWLLETLGLASVVRTPVRRLSGGQAQRLNLAIALVGRPELLFLDEPTAGLDPQARHLVWDLLRAARSDGVSILLTTHLLDEAELLADQVVIVDAGRVVAQGSVAELVAGDEHLTFSAISGLALDRLRDALPDGYLLGEPRAGHYRIDGPVTPAMMATVTAWCAQSGILATDLAIGRRGLEDVYLAATGRTVRP
jgi:ABC-2 type transport system ATP-binding protein